MVDYSNINDSMEQTRQEVRRLILAEGASAERAAIVAWLRLQAEIFDWHGRADERIAMFAASDAIERGDHVKPRALGVK